MCNKLLRKKCRECDHKQYSRLDDYRLEQHLRGNKIYGIYPLLEDNSSYFLAADFDGEKWEKGALAFLNVCRKYKLPAYLERSRSGNGGHAWIFFEEKYPASKSRNIAIYLLREAKIIDQFDKDDSFDRLFPNQDLLSGEGFGNLIALPLQGESRKSDNTVFLDWENDFNPFADQWEFLQKVEKISVKKLDNLFESFNQSEKSSIRNGKIADDIKKEADAGMKCLVLTERKEHVEVLSWHLKKDCEIIELTGDLTEKRRREKIKQIQEGNFQVLLATGQLIGEGTDFQNLDCLFLVYPFAFHGKLTQYIGRIQRGGQNGKKIYDYRDRKVEYLERLFKKRLKYYQKNFGSK